MTLWQGVGRWTACWQDHSTGELIWPKTYSAVIVQSPTQLLGPDELCLTAGFVLLNRQLLNGWGLKTITCSRSLLLCYQYSPWTFVQSTQCWSGRLSMLHKYETGGKTRGKPAVDVRIVLFFLVIRLGFASSTSIPRLCAAPGSKTLQILDLMRQEDCGNAVGLLVANDSKASRLRSNRLGKLLLDGIGRIWENGPKMLQIHVKHSLRMFEIFEILVSRRLVDRVRRIPTTPLLVTRADARLCKALSCFSS